MSLRSWRERAIQTLLFEAGGIAVATPAFAYLFGAAPGESLTLIVALSVTVMIWAPLHNAAFDLAEWQVFRRVASDRPPHWRVIHAISHEASVMVVTLPMVMMLTGLDLKTALIVELGLTLFYAGYALVFYWLYDLWRPVPLGQGVRP
jgi:uncharacterized membrane protein